MQYKAIVSFSGNKLSMAKGTVRELSDQSLIDDLTNAGYIIPMVADKIIKPEKPEEKAEKPKPKRKGKANEN